MQQGTAAGAPGARRIRRGWSGATVAAALLAVIAVLLSPVVAPAQAQAASNPAAGFKSGNIISDANFYDGTAMTGAQVRSFLKEQMPRCTIGDAGRKAGSAYGSTKIAKFCLRDAKFTTKTRPADAYCKAVPGKKNELASHFIARVGKACSISQKVLLVMLQKEQSLVGDSWPTERQFGFAMGWNCPDSGPNNSANCDGSSSGFPEQVYRGARQLQVYKGNPDNYNYKPFQKNTIKWNPNPSCGTSSVYISNWATAALYIYTPYRPNRAALQGRPDSCSSTGNLNFYKLYKGWFGSPTAGYAVHKQLQKYYKSTKSVVGKPISKAKSQKGGIVQRFEKANMYWHPKTGAAVVRGEILGYYKKYQEMGGKLGTPIGRQSTSAGTHSQRFSKAKVFWRKSTGMLEVRGTAFKYYNKKGKATFLGRPTTNQIGSSSSGIMQDFSKRRTITWSKKAPVRTVKGAIRGVFLKDGGVKKLGYAKAEQKTVTGGRQQQFSKADIYWSKSHGAFSVTGHIRKTLNQNGGVKKLGMPTSARVKTSNGGLRQTFKKKAIVWTKSGGGRVVSLSSPQAKAKSAPSTAPVEPVESQTPKEPQEQPQTDEQATGSTSGETEQPEADGGVDAAAGEDGVTGAEPDAGAAADATGVRETEADASGSGATVPGREPDTGRTAG